MKKILIFLLATISTGSTYATQKTLSCPYYLRDDATSQTSGATMPIFDKDHFYWNFPSDHLPAVGIISLTASCEKFAVISWNVLNENYLKRMLSDEDTQGLKISEISALQDRSQRVLEILSEIVTDIQPAIIGLQEVDFTLLEKLRQWALEHGFGLELAVNPSRKNGTIVDHGVVLFDQKSFRPHPRLNELATFEGEAKAPVKYIQKVGLTSNAGVDVGFVNTHRHFDDEHVFRAFLARHFDHPVIIVGDLNLDRPSAESLVAQFPLYSLLQKGPGAFTHIDLSRTLQDYDHILVSGNATISYDTGLHRSVQRRFSITAP